MEFTGRVYNERLVAGVVRVKQGAQAIDLCRAQFRWSCMHMR